MTKSHPSSTSNFSSQLQLLRFSDPSPAKLPPHSTPLSTPAGPFQGTRSGTSDPFCTEPQLHNSARPTAAQTISRSSFRLDSILNSLQPPVFRAHKTSETRRRIGAWAVPESRFQPHEALLSFCIILIVLLLPPLTSSTYPFDRSLHWR